MLKAKISPPIEGTSSLAAVARRRGGGGRRGAWCARIDVAAWAGARARRPQRIIGGLAATVSSGGLAAPRVSARRSSRFGCSACNRSAREVLFGRSRPRSSPSPDLSSRDRVVASRGFCSLAPAAALPISLALAPSRVPRNRRKLLREKRAVRPRPTNSGAERHRKAAPESGQKTIRKRPRRISPAPNR